MQQEKHNNKERKHKDSWKCTALKMEQSCMAMLQWQHVVRDQVPCGKAALGKAVEVLLSVVCRTPLCQTEEKVLLGSSSHRDEGTQMHNTDTGVKQFPNICLICYILKYILYVNDRALVARAGQCIFLYMI